MIGDRWGVNDADTARSYPCDEYVSGRGLQAWRAVAINATPAQIWPWLVQLRLAPYSYDWVDNRGRRSPQDLLGLEDPRPGDPFTASAGRPLGRVLAVEHHVHLTARIMATTVTYQLVPETAATTRLVMKLAGGNRLFAPLLSVGDLVMARRQLLNLKRLAEAGTAEP